MKTFRTAYDFKSKDENGRWLEFSDEQLLLCSSRVLGYELDRKIWVLMLVDNIKTISQHSDESAFDDLVLPDDLETDNTKFLIKSLVKHHMTARSSQSSARIGGLEDFVEGKGRGLVILLHGEQ